MKRFGSLFSKRMRRLAEAYGPRVGVHMDELESGPQTLTHGDFRLENMFFGAGEGDAFTVIDWQAAGMIGNGLYDVAYFMVTSVPSEVRRDVERDACGSITRSSGRMGAKDFSNKRLLEPLSPERAEICFVPCICACGGLDMTNPRMRALGETMVQRTLAAIEDLDAHEFLPGGGRPLAPVRAFPILSRSAYEAYKVLYGLCGPRTWRSPI